MYLTPTVVTQRRLLQGATLAPADTIVADDIRAAVGTPVAAGTAPAADTAELLLPVLEEERTAADIPVRSERSGHA